MFINFSGKDQADFVMLCKIVYMMIDVFSSNVVLRLMLETAVDTWIKKLCLSILTNFMPFHANAPLSM